MTEHKVKVVLFYKNGDSFYRGYHVSVTPRRFKNFENLLAELTRVTSLPQGVRFIFTPDTGKCISSLDQLEDGKAYVCSSYQKLKKVSYGASPDNLDRRVEQKSFIPVPSKPPMQIDNEVHNSNSNVKPKIITVIRYGVSRPRKAVKILLNKRTAQTFDQVLNDITSSVGVSGGFGVRKLFSSKGKLILSLSELISDGDVFIAVGSEKFHLQDLDDILQEHGFGRFPSSCILKFSSSDSTMLKHGSNQPLWKCPEHRKCNNENVVELDQQASSKQAGFSERGRGSFLERKPALHLNSHTMLPNIGNVKSPLKKSRLNDPAYSEPDTIDELKSQVAEVNGRNSPIKEPIQFRRPKDFGAEIVKSDPAVSANDFPGGCDSAEAVQSRSAIPVRVGGSNKASPCSSPSLTKSGFRTASALAQRSGSSSSDFPARPRAPASQREIADSLDINSLFEVGKVLGDGNFAVVKFAKNRVTREEVALKIIDRRKLVGKEAMLDNEICIQKSCSHPNICTLHEDIHSPDSVFLVMELVTGGDFFDLISTNVKFEEFQAAGYVRDICRALEYLHYRKIVHRDLKPENLMVCKMQSGGSILKLADFGLAMKVTELLFTVCGTPTYVAPEILTEEGYGLEVDVWAAGVIMYISLCGFPPFRSPDRNQAELFDLIESGQFEFLPPYWDDISDEAKDLLSRVLVVSPRTRYSARDILHHSWMTVYGLEQSNRSDDDPSISAYSQSPQRGVNRFKKAALTVQSVERMKRMVDLHVKRGEEFITQTSPRGSARFKDGE